MNEGILSQDAGDPGLALWQICLDELSQELPEQQFNTWIKPLTAQVAEDFSKVTIFVANRFKLDWIRAQYVGKLSAMFERLQGQKMIVELALATREAPGKTAYSVVKAAQDAAASAIEPIDDSPVNGFKNRLNTALMTLRAMGAAKTFPLPPWPIPPPSATITTTATCGLSAGAKPANQSV